MSIGKLADVDATPYHSLFASVSYRFVDRDMSMRYMLGLGVGHTYAHTDIHGRDLGSRPEEVPDWNDAGDGIDAGEGNGTMDGLEEAGGEDTGDELDKIEDDEDDDDQECGEDDEEGEGEEEDFDKGSDYTDDETIPSETGGSQDSEDEEEY